MPPRPVPPLGEDVTAAAGNVALLAADKLFPSALTSTAGPISLHSPSSSISSHHSERSRVSSHSLSYAAHLPIGVGHPHVLGHGHLRTFSNKSSILFSTTSNGAEPSGTQNASWRVSRMSFTYPSISSTRMTEASSISVRRQSFIKSLPHSEGIESSSGERGTPEAASILGLNGSPVPVTGNFDTGMAKPLSDAAYISVGTRMRSRSSTMMPTSTVFFHLPTGMLHKSQSHAQLRAGGSLSTSLAPVISSVAQTNVLLHSQLTISSSQHPPSSSKTSPVLFSAGTGARPRARRPSRSVLSPKTLSPVRSRTRSKSPSYTSTSSASIFNNVQEKSEVDEEGTEDAPGRSHMKKSSQGHKNQILESLESRVPSLSSASSRNAVYINSDELNVKLDELLLLAKEHMERQAEEDNDGPAEDSEEGDETVENVIRSGENKKDQCVAGLTTGGKGDEWVSTQLRSPPNTPVIGYFGTAAFVPALGAATIDVVIDSNKDDLQAARSSQVYVGNNPTSRINSQEGLNEEVPSVEISAETTNKPTPPIRPPPAPPLDIVDVSLDSPVVLMDKFEPLGIRNESRCRPQIVDQQGEQVDTEEEDELLDEALAYARELAVEDRMIWDVRSLEMYEDDGGEFEDEEMGIGMVGLGGMPRVRMSRGAGPYGSYLSVEGCDAGANMHSQEMFKDNEEGHVRFCFSEEDDLEGGPVSSMSRWSLTSSIDDEKRLTAESKPKKEKRRRSFVPFANSGDKDKDSDSKEEGTWSKESTGLGKKRSRLASFISRLSSVGLGSGNGAKTPPLETPPIPLASASGSTHVPSLLPSPVITAKSSLRPSTPGSAPSSRSPSPSVDRNDQSQSQMQKTPEPAAHIERDAELLQVMSESPTVENMSPVSPVVAPAILSGIQAPKTSPKGVSKPRRLPPGLVIPPVPTRPVPTPPGVPSAPVPLGKAASDGLIGADKSSTQFPSRARSASSRDVRKNFTLPASTSAHAISSEIGARKLELPTWNDRQHTLTKSASSSVLALNKHVLTSGPFSNLDTPACYFYDPEQSNVPPTPTSIASMDDHDDGHFSRRQKKMQTSQHGFQTRSTSRPRLRGMSSLIALSSNHSAAPAAMQGKGGLKGLVGRITGRAGNSKASTATVVIPHSVESSVSHETVTPVSDDSRKTLRLVHSPTTSLSTSGGVTTDSGNGSGFLSSFASYLERSSRRQ